MVRRHKTTIFLDTKEDATVADVKKMLSGLIKRSPEDQRLSYQDKILEDKEELRQHFQAKAHCPALIGLMLKDEQTGQFETLHITNYSDPPELPSAMEKDEDSCL